jgi:branched-chain amino acid transport system substrate-binding protein
LIRREEVMERKSFERVAAIVFVLALFMGWSLFVQTATAEQGVVKVGLSAPLTGDWAEYGADFKRSCQMVIDGVNRMGGIHGKRVELAVEDSRGDPKEAVLIAEKFIADRDIISEIGDFSSSACMAAAPIYDKANMTQLSPTSSHQDFTKKGKNMFRVVATQSFEGPQNAAWAVRDLGKKRLATIYINNDWGVDANKFFVTEAKRLGAKVLAEESFVPGEKDFTAILSRIKGMNPELVYIPVFYVDAAAILNQAKRMRFEPVWMGNSSLFTEKLIELGGEAADGIILPANYFTSDPRPAAQEFLREYRALYGNDPNQFAALAYDAANLTVAALQWVGVEDRSKVREALINLRGFQGATGPISYAESRDPVKEMVRITIKNGKWVLYTP